MSDCMPVANPWLGRMRDQFIRLRARFETFISGRAPDDPLYLTNRSWKHKLIVGAVVSVPILILLVVVLLATTNVFRTHDENPYERPVAENQAPSVPVRHLPDPTIAPSDLEVVNIHIVRTAHPATVTGELRNNTSRKVNSAEVSYYLADEGGSLLGTETLDVDNLAPHGSTTFHLPLKQPNAEYVIVRTVHAR